MLLWGLAQNGVKPEGALLNAAASHTEANLHRYGAQVGPSLQGCLCWHLQGLLICLV